MGDRPPALCARIELSNSTTTHVLSGDAQLECITSARYVMRHALICTMNEHAAKPGAEPCAPDAAPCSLCGVAPELERRGRIVLTMPVSWPDDALITRLFEREVPHGC